MTGGSSLAGPIVIVVGAPVLLPRALLCAVVGRPVGEGAKVASRWTSYFFPVARPR